MFFFDKPNIGLHYLFIPSMPVKYQGKIVHYYHKLYFILHFASAVKFTVNLDENSKFRIQNVTGSII